AQASIEPVRLVLRVLRKEKRPRVDGGAEVVAPVAALDGVDVRHLGQREQRASSASPRHDRRVELLERACRVVLEAPDEPFLLEDGPGRVAGLTIRDRARGELALDD